MGTETLSPKTFRSVQLIKKGPSLKQTYVQQGSSFMCFHVHLKQASGASVPQIFSLGRRQRPLELSVLPVTCKNISSNTGSVLVKAGRRRMLLKTRKGGENGKGEET